LRGKDPRASRQPRDPRPVAGGIAGKGSERDARARRLARCRIVGRVRLDVARDLAAALDLDLAVADRAGDPAAGADEKPLSDRQIALETAAHLDFVDCRRALEEP